MFDRPSHEWINGKNFRSSNRLGCLLEKYKNCMHRHSRYGDINVLIAIGTMSNPLIVMKRLIEQDQEVPKLPRIRMSRYKATLITRMASRAKWEILKEEVVIQWDQHPG